MAAVFWTAEKLRKHFREPQWCQDDMGWSLTQKKRSLPRITYLVSFDNYMRIYQGGLVTRHQSGEFGNTFHGVSPEQLEELVRRLSPEQKARCLGIAMISRGGASG